MRYPGKPVITEEVAGYMTDALQAILGDTPILGDLLEILTGNEDGNASDFGTFINQLLAIGRGETVSSPLDTLVGMAPSTARTVADQIEQLFSGAAVTPINTLVSDVADFISGSGILTGALEAGSAIASMMAGLLGLGNVAGAAQENSLSLADNINAAVAGGVAAGAGAIEDAFATIASIFGLAGSAQQIALTAQQQIQNFDNANNSGTYDGESWQTSFAGSDGSVLPSGDWPAGSTQIVIRGSNGYAGIQSGAADGVYHKICAKQFTLDSQAAGILLGDQANSDQQTGILLRSNSDFTAGVYCGVSTTGIVIGKYTRTGPTASWTRTQFASQAMTLRTGDIVYFKCHETNYFVYVNGTLALSYTETANTVPVGASYRYTGFSMQRSSLILSYDSFRVVAFAMSDWVSAGVAVTTTPSWRISRSSTSQATISNLARGDSAVVPSGFFSSQEYLVDATVDTLGLGRVEITTAGFYEIAASILVAHSSGGTPEGPQFAAVYVNGSRAATAVPLDTPVILYLAEGDIVQPGATYLANNTSFSSTTYNYVNRLEGGPSAYFQGRLVSKG